MSKGGSYVLLLNVLLAMSLGGCASLGKKNAKTQHNAAMGENVCSIDDTRLLEIARIAQRFERLFGDVQQNSLYQWHEKAEASANSDENGDKEHERDAVAESTGPDKDDYDYYSQWTDTNGALHVEVGGEAEDKSNYQYTAQIYPDGTKIILYDAGIDGSIDARIEERFGKQVLLQTYLIDIDGDGVFDERITLTFDFEKGENHRACEKAIWGVTLKKTEPQKKPFPPEMKSVPETKESFNWETVEQCETLGKKSAEKQRNTAIGKEERTDDKRLLEIAELTQELEQISKAAHRRYYDETIKLPNHDADSYGRYRQLTDDNGVLRVEIECETLKPSWKSLYRYTAHIVPDGRKIILYDAGSDRNIDIRIEEKPGNQVLLQTYFIDSDGDGIFDERVTLTFDFEKGEKHRVVEKIIWKTVFGKTELRETPFFPKMKIVPKTKAGISLTSCKFKNEKE